MLAHGLDSRSSPTRQRIEHHHAADSHQRPLVQLLKPQERPVERRQRVDHVLSLGSGAVTVIGAEQRFTSVIPRDGYLVRRPLLSVGWRRDVPTDVKCVCA